MILNIEWFIMLKDLSEGKFAANRTLTTRNVRETQIVWLDQETLQ